MQVSWSCFVHLQTKAIIVLKAQLHLDCMQVVAVRLSKDTQLSQHACSIGCTYRKHWSLLSCDHICHHTLELHDLHHVVHAD